MTDVPPAGPGGDWAACREGAAMNGRPTAAAAGKIDVGGDLTVNRLGFGAMRITGPGIWGDPPDRDEAIRTLRRAVELGADFIDTADSYGPFVSEDLIAQVPITESVGAIPGTSKLAHLEQ